MDMREVTQKLLIELEFVPNTDDEVVKTQLYLIKKHLEVLDLYLTFSKLHLSITPK